MKIKWLIWWICLLTLVEAEATESGGGNDWLNVTKDDILRCITSNGTSYTGHDYCFRCLNDENAITLEKVCDGMLDCSDFSDECLCEIRTIPKEACEVLYDPEVDPKELCSKQPGHVNCGEGKCLTLNEVCEDLENCPNGIGKKLCRNKNTQTIGIDIISCNKTSDEGGATLIDAVMCDGIVECDEREDECSDHCLSSEAFTLPLFCTPELSCIPGPLICDGIWHSENVSACGNARIPEEETDCPNNFNCASSGKLSIPVSKVCDGVLDCDDGSDEDISQNCTDGRFYCYDSHTLTRNNLSSFEMPFIPKTQVFDGRGNCPDARDECHKHKLAFNSETEMVASPVLRGFLWFNGVQALCSNTAVLCYTLYAVIRKRKLLHVISRCHHLLIINLILANLLMSMSLLGVAIQGVHFSGRYCENDLAWRTSDTCTALGTISLISSEMSITVMLIMAVFRMATIYKPVETYYSRKTEKLVRSFIVLGWIISTTVAILPLLGNLRKEFTSHSVIKCPIYETNMAEIRIMKGISARILTYMRKTNSSQSRDLSYIDSPSNIQKIHKVICPQSEIKWIGFYGQNSICMPRIFANPQDPGWKYSVSLLAYNFIAFFIIMICYVIIVRISTRPNKEMGKNTGVPVCKLQARVTKLVVTDFLCWIPVCVIGFVYASGVPISSTLYAVCGIVLIPINSAVNPALYSGITDSCMKRTRKFCRRTKSPPPSSCTGAKNSQAPSVKTEIFFLQSF